VIICSIADYYNVLRYVTDFQAVPETILM